MNLHIVTTIVSFIITVILAMIILPILRRLKVGQTIRDDGPKTHLKKQGTPTMGGIIIEISMMISCILVYIYFKINEPSYNIQNIFPLLFVSIGFGMIGFIDDFKKLVLKDTKGLKPSYKMIGLLAVSVCYVLYLTYVLQIGTDILIPFFNQYIAFPVWMYIPFAIFVLLATTNAINLTDGVDGLSSSVTAIIIAFFMIVGVTYAMIEISIFSSILVGACLGFLLFNLHPAKMFMGDTGSLMLGGAISGMALYSKTPLLLLIVALIPILETVSVMIQVSYFKKTGKRVFKMAPLHHHFELSGWSENKVVMIFSIITLMLCIIGTIAIKV